MDRRDILKELEAKPEVEVLVIGGGVNGAGVFRELALQGLRVLLLEAGDLCSGSSSASSHMAHGGIRYLENGEFRLVAEAVFERDRLLANAPHLVRPLPTLIPIFKLLSGLLNAPLKFLGLRDRPSERGALVIKLGLLLYEALHRGRGGLPRHRFEGAAATRRLNPALNREVSWTATYYDGQILSPERLVVELVLDGEALGKEAFALNYAPVLGLDPEAGWIAFRDEPSGKVRRIKPRLIVNAGGPWIDRVNAGLGLEINYIGATKGSHIVVDNPELHAALGGREFFFENADGRIVLILPWFDRVLIGTSDLQWGDPDSARCTPEEMDYFIDLTARVFPDLRIEKSQIVFSFSGLRPLPTSRARWTGQISRDHSLRENRIGALPVYSLVGGKWTTFRAFSEQVGDRVLASLGRRRLRSTARLPIGGGADWPGDEATRTRFTHDLAKTGGLTQARASELFERYGTRSRLFAHRFGAAGDEPLAHLPSYSRQEITLLVELEKVLRLDDLVLRRSLLAWLGRLSLPALEELADAMGAALGWSGVETDKEIARVTDLLVEAHDARL